MRSYFMTSERLGFGTWSRDDLPLAECLWGDPDVTRYTGGPFSPTQVVERLTLEIRTLERHGIQYWPIFLRDTAEHVGCCGLRPRTGQHAILELGFQLRRAHWRRGYGREAARTTIFYAFTALKAKALFAGHHPNNDASRLLLDSLGFHYSHDEYYPPTRQMEPSYLLSRPELTEP